MFDCWYQFLKDFQTLVVGALGFLGVIYTLRVNSRLSREQHERKIEHEHEVLRTALSAELALIQKSFIQNSNTMDDEHGVSDAFFPERVSTEVYQANLNKLGLLTAEQVSAVIKAYALAEEVPTRLRLLSSGHDNSYNKPGYIFIQQENYENAVNLYKALHPEIQKALNMLESC